MKEMETRQDMPACNITAPVMKNGCNVETTLTVGWQETSQEHWWMFQQAVPQLQLVFLKQ